MSKSLHVDFLIIGGGIAGTTAAETIRTYSEGTILIVTDDRHTLYSRVRLPDYIIGKIPREKVFIKDESQYGSNGINLVKGVSVESLSLKEQRAYLSNGMTIRYDKLLMASGGVARRLRCAGFELDGIHYLRTIEDAELIQQAMKISKRALVIGGGFIGLELARCFLQGGLETVMVMMEPQFWPAALDKESSRMIEETLREQGVLIHYSDHVKEFWGNAHVQRVLLGSGKSYGCEMVGVGIGIDTLPPFTRTSRLQTHQGILTDECLRTSDFHVYAAGDVAEFYSMDYRRPHQIGNWSNAAEQGKIAGLNMVGQRTAFQSVGSYVIRVFGLSVGFVGDTTLVPGTQVIQRGSSSDKSYVRLLIRDGVIKGATLINQSHEIPSITELIRTAVKVDPLRSNLRDIGCDLGSCLTGHSNPHAPSYST
jgi:NAD(P)H-nitrite reductase large subunit